MKPADLHVVVPGPLDQRTGGFIYDARMVGQLREQGRAVTVHELAGRFPEADFVAQDSLRRCLASVPTGSRVLLDGLAVGALPESVARHTVRLQCVAIVHHLLGDETGLTSTEQARFLDLERKTLQACRGVIVTSPFTAGRLVRLGIASARVRAVPPGLDPAAPARGPAAGRPPQLLCVGAVTPRKGQAVLVRALAGLRSLAWKCVCAGSLTRAPGYAAALTRQVAWLGLEGRIALAGECGADGLEELYAASTLFVLPSYYEGYGMVLGEALARGLPVVSTTGGAIPETVPENAGVLVPPGDAPALAGAIKSLLADATECRRAGAAARRHVRSLPGWPAAAQAFSAALDALTDGTSQDG